ncbi:MAG: hypothetical protein ACP5E9_09445 [Candidatus Methanospirareceae archaeon]
MSDKKRVRVFFCNPAGEMSCDLTVTPEVRVTQREGVTQIAIGSHDLELTLRFFCPSVNLETGIFCSTA